MPIYEYRCSKCGDRVEVRLASMDSEACCPHCGSPLKDKLISLPFISRSGHGPAPQRTCCGREDRCDSPPCGDDGNCQRI
jgi:putative FmdB family regulatory protein